MKKVGVFRTTAGIASEAFISEQVAAYKSYQPTIVCRDIRGGSIAAKGGVVDIGGEVDKKIWTLTRNPGFFDLRSIGDINIIHAHFGPDGVMAYPLAKKLKLPIVVTYHGFDVTIKKYHMIFSKKPTDYWYYFMERQIMNGGGKFIAVSDFIVDKLLSRGYPLSKIERCYIGVDVNKFIPLSDVDKKHINDDYILCVGRHVRKKGVDKLIAAWSLISKKHPRVKLIQIGSGPLTEYLKKLAYSLGVSDSVIFKGACPHNVVLDMMRGAKIFALPSEQAKNGDCEALGIVFNEASACGIPIVSTFHGGIPEAVLHGRTGLLSTPGDIESLAGNLSILLNNRNMMHDYGAMGREYVVENFNIKKQTENLESIYDNLLGL